jgi:hypothetical protein
MKWGQKKKAVFDASFVKKRLMAKSQPVTAQ